MSLPHSLNYRIPRKDLIQKYLGIPYCHLGRSEKGLDCWGLPILIYRDHGVEITDVKNYDTNWVEQGLNYFVTERTGHWFKVLIPHYLDILLFKNDQGIIFHAGIYLSHSKFLQSIIRTGVIISSLHPQWQLKLEGVYRYDTSYIRT